LLRFREDIVDRSKTRRENVFVGDNCERIAPAFLDKWE
jgi:hypothetical protein